MLQNARELASAAPFRGGRRCKSLCEWVRHRSAVGCAHQLRAARFAAEVGATRAEQWCKISEPLQSFGVRSFRKQHVLAQRLQEPSTTVGTPAQPAWAVVAGRHRDAALRAR